MISDAKKPKSRRRKKKGLMLQWIPFKCYANAIKITLRT